MDGFDPAHGRLRDTLFKYFGFDRPRNVVMACAAVALLCGLVSLALGQDRNWDLRNYHLYNAYAWLDGRLLHDLAPAQLQSYFTPFLDLPYFWMATHWPAPVAGLVLGAFHGLAFAFAAAIAWHVLEGEPHRARLTPMLALAGCTGAAFLSGLGNTMGDNATAVLVLGSVCLLIPQRSPAIANPWSRLTVSGIVLGVAIGLKLTNAPYAVALGVATFVLPPHGTSRLKAVVLLTVAASVSFVLVAGPWFWTVWEAFGNPLFPQFNAAFQAPLAQPISVADSKWGPRGWGEALAWPLLFTVEPGRVSNSPLPQVIWAVLYLVGCAWLAKGLRDRWQRPTPASAAETADPALRFLLLFFLIAFAVWMLLFGIYRYLVVLELLAPLLLWLGLRPWSTRAAGVVVLACALVSLVGWNTWGHAGWSARGFSVQQPDVEGDARIATVALVGGAPMAWMIPFMPREIAYVSLASNFPESPEYAARVREMIAHRGGPAYAIIPAAIDKPAERLRRIDSALDTVGLSGERRDCGPLEWLVARARPNTEVTQAPSNGGVTCRLQVPASLRLDIDAENRVLAVSARQVSSGYGLDLDVDECRTYAASIGRDELPYQWCPLILAKP